jgi:opacity protein-like surface antigen
LGVAGGYGWSPNVTLEGEFNLLPSSENGGLVEVSSSAWSLTGNLLYHFAPRTFRPYAVIGMGFGHATVDAEGAGQAPGAFDESSNEFVVNLGGGVERAIRENLRFRGDLRYFFGGDLVPDYWRLSAGLQFGLGRR